MVNAQAVHFGLMMGLAFDCEIAPRSIFHRKNYFYPDQPKGYQISQYDIPLCAGGRLGDVRLHRIHLEEDAAKLIHLGESGRIHGSSASIVDFNRGGTPLAEIVSEPDIRSAEQAREWLTLLRVTLRQLGVSDVNMEEGSLRCDANVSVRPAGSEELGTKTELKNMNSFRFLVQGINAEIERQIALLEAGEAVSQETLHFDPASGRLTLAALQGGGARLPLLPRARPRPARADRGDARRPRAPRCPSCPRSAPSATSATGGCRPTPRGCSRSSPSWGDYFEAAAAAAAPSRAPVANWVNASCAAPGAESTRRRRMSRRPRWPSSSASSHGAQRHARRRRARCSTGWSRDGGDPAEIVEREGLGAMGDDGELAGDRRARDRGATRRRRARPRRQPEGDRRAGRPGDEGDQGPRRRRRGQPPRCASSWASEASDGAND